VRFKYNTNISVLNVSGVVTEIIEGKGFSKLVRLRKGSAVPKRLRNAGLGGK